MNHAPGVELITGAVDQQSSTLPLCYGGVLLCDFLLTCFVCHRSGWSRPRKQTSRIGRPTCPHATRPASDAGHCPLLVTPLTLSSPWGCPVTSPSLTGPVVVWLFSVSSITRSSSRTHRDTQGGDCRTLWLYNDKEMITVEGMTQSAHDYFIHKTFITSHHNRTGSVMWHCT